jgi:hypothetical protein
MAEENKPTKPAAKKTAKKAAKTTAAKKVSKKTTKKPAPTKPEEVKKAPPSDRETKIIARPTLSANVPTAPKKIKPQYASFRSSRKSLTNPRRVRGGVKLKLKPDEQPSSWITQKMVPRDRSTAKVLSMLAPDKPND